MAINRYKTSLRMFDDFEVGFYGEEEKKANASVSNNYFRISIRLNPRPEDVKQKLRKILLRSESGQDCLYHMKTFDNMTRRIIVYDEKKSELDYHIETETTGELETLIQLVFDTYRNEVVNELPDSQDVKTELDRIVTEFHADELRESKF